MARKIRGGALVLVAAGRLSGLAALSRAGRSIAVVAIAMALSALVACSTPPRATAIAPAATGVSAMAIEQVAVVDVASGRVTSPRTVLIVGKRIAAIGRPGTVAIPAGAMRVDGRGRYLMPSLVDMHVHLFNNATHRPPNDWMFPLFVATGVLAVREMNARPQDLQTIRRWRWAVARGSLLAPRILAAGVAVDAGALDAIRPRVREAAAAGADFIKVFSESSAAHWRVILDESRRLGIPVSGHVPAQVSLLTAARSGQRTDEHLMQAYEACSSTEEAFIDARTQHDGEGAAALRDAQEPAVLAAFDQRACSKVAAAVARSGQTQVPTLVLPYFEANPGPPAYRDDARWHGLRPDEQARWAKALDHRPDDDMALRQRRWLVSQQIVRTLHAAGVPILAGTDAPMPLVYPGHALHEELELLVDAGLCPAEALRSATLGAAEFLGTSATSGSIAVGKRADLILLDANPLARISNTRRIDAVVFEGRLLRRAQLDAMLGAAARARF